MAHEREFVANGGGKPGPERGIWEVLRGNVWLDAVIYGEAGLMAAVEAGGAERVMFGTDHPFFPPLGEEKDGKWLSVQSNLDAIEGVAGKEGETVRGILGGNAMRVFGLD